MKRKKSLFFALLIAVMVCFGTCMVSVSAEAAVTNVMKSPKAKAGKLVKNTKGIRYQYTDTKKYARKEWLNISGKIYYFTSTGYARTGWLTYNSRKYYFNKNGKLVTGWLTSGGHKYYIWKNKDRFSGSAAMGKVKIGSYYYCFSSKCIMLTGWRKISGQYYYFYKSTGRMAVNAEIGSYYVDASGRKTDNPNDSELVKTGKVDWWVGDSRTVGLGIVKGISSKCIAKVGEGYSWFISSAEATLKKKLKADPDATVVFNFGVNDINNISKYISRYRKLMAAYPKAHFYFLSVNPIDSKYTAGYVSNSKIKAFNKKLKAAFPQNYIDTYTFLVNDGFSTVDGLHYTTSTYKLIYNYVLKKV